MGLKEKDYPVLKDWYEEWVKINKAFIIVGVSIVAYTISVFDLAGGESSIDEDKFLLLKKSWMFISAGCASAGLSICVAYLWIDVIRRENLPHLAGKVYFVRKLPLQIVYVGALGWVFSIASFLSLGVGYYFAGIAAFSFDPGS